MIHGLAICAGAGGLELGLGLALGPAYATACFVEGEAYAAACLVARMAEGSMDAAPVWDDLRTFDGRPWRGVVDLVSAGFPCQPVSQAGLARGTADDRWLWPHVRRIIAEVGPSIVFLENVRGLRTANKGAALGEVLADLARLGFVGAWGTVRASDAGAPHERARVFILGVAPDADPALWDPAGRLGRPRGQGEAVVGDDGEDRPLAYARGGGCKASGGDRREGEAQRHHLECCGGTLAHADSGGLEGERGGGLLDRLGQAHGDDAYGRGVWGRDPWAVWEAEPDVGRVVDGLAPGVDRARTHRLRMTGNGVVPQQAALAWHLLTEILQ